ncbi:MAG: class I SAM-dependent methyltransferase [Ignavibacteriales bacterium]|nr:class I SAM-dependent methyltransferase [Ignavibacteriales bacterium]MCF8305687.1 class I SAM-dependent methyltransferase [Ignavibacteriales bacterium]MCF8315409.1 class I SAM-dependent methyltransferase [Ignavibacteriales bacterium]MCF8436699.1 class I SAM-dependent methyltransferase [Ignavibacteriales bacterium]
MGNLSNKNVLDLGCFSGNPLSLEIAAKAKTYLGVDLSQKAIEELNGKLKNAGLTNAEAKSVDFLSPEFGDDKFDIIYAHSVMHHFKHFDVFIEKLSRHLKPGGRVISYDPMQTQILLRTSRILYRPFQSDAGWEWPFRKVTFHMIQEHFRIMELQGVVGSVKYALPLTAFSNSLAVNLGKKLYAKDRQKAKSLNGHLWGCLQVTMCMVKK